jgi:hypothetical protein
MEVIAKREKEHPTGKFTDVDTAWASFCENYLPLAGDDKSLYDEEDTDVKQKPFTKSSPSRIRSRLLRTVCITAAIAALLLTGTVAANALGIDLWGAVAKWTRDTFGFSNTVANTEESKVPSNGSEYESLQDALDNYGTTAKVTPTWFPEGYSFESTQVIETPAQTAIAAKYSGKNGEILIKITLLSKPSTRAYEKDGEDVTVYSANGIEHYIMSNLDQTKIVWQSENCECSISGPFELDEAEKMIESMYERN